MSQETQSQVASEQDLSESELVDNDSLEPIEDPPVRLAGYNQIPDFGDDTRGTLHESENELSNAK